MEFFKVLGCSMQPSIYENDLVLVSKCNHYDVGDVIVYDYNNEGVLVHRILLCRNKKYYCKGDNSFRLESVSCDKIYGKVLLIYRNYKKIPIVPMNEEFLKLSFQISVLFNRYNCNKARVMETAIYKKYYSEYLKFNKS